MKSWKDLSISLAGLTPAGVPWPTPREAIEWVGASGFRAIQLDAAMPGLRPRELDSSARKGVASLLKRLELTFTGIDLWIPPEHFTRPDTQQRAVDAVEGALGLADELKAAELPPVVSIRLPEVGGSWRVHLESFASKLGVAVADHGVEGARSTVGAAVGAGIDPAAELERGQDPAALVSRLGASLVSARLTDWKPVRRVSIGRGALDLMAYGAALATMQFGRPVVADVRGVDSALESALQAKTQWPPL